MIPCYGTHGSKPGDITRNSLVLCRHAGQRTNKSIQEEHKIWIFVAEAYRYVAQFRPYQGAKKGKQVACSTKWGLGENVVLRLMECLTSTFNFNIFMDNYFTYLHLLTHLGDDKN